MEFCTITTKGYWDKMYEQPYVMLLSHLALKYPEYVDEALKHPECYKYIDNSIIELGNTFTIDKILDAARLTKSNCVILPDGYPAGDKTRDEISKAVKYIEDNHLENEFDYMCVCHGVDREDFKKTFDYINSIPWVTHIGIPKVLTTWTERSDLFDIWGNTDKQIHFLGAWYNLKELRDIPLHIKNRITSLDTCLPELYAIQLKDMYEDREGTINLEEEYLPDWDLYYDIMNTINNMKGVSEL